MRDVEDPVGLCARCRFARTVRTPRTVYWLCRRSFIEPDFPKYPRLPVLACRGYEPGVPQAPAERLDEESGRG